MSNLLKQYKELPDLLLKPKKITYPKEQLYQNKFERENIAMVRKDYRVKNKEGHHLECYLFARKDAIIDEEEQEQNQPAEDEDSDDEDEEAEIEPGTNLIVFLHPRGGNVTEGKFLVSSFTPANAVLLFDFAGSGLSEGEYITLGMNETRDLKLVLDHTKTLIKVRRVVLWGRSMGAVTAIMFTKIFNNMKRFLVTKERFKERNPKFFKKLEKNQAKQKSSGNGEEDSGKEENKEDGSNALGELGMDGENEDDRLIEGNEALNDKSGDEDMDQGSDEDDDEDDEDVAKSEVKKKRKKSEKEFSLKLNFQDQKLNDAEESPEDENAEEENEQSNRVDDDLDEQAHILVLDSPFATFRGMIHDVIKSQYNVSGCCINIALSGVLKGCKKKVSRDLTTIKPIEAVPHITVPCFYIVGKKDIIARPDKVKSLFMTTSTQYKEFWTFKGEHNSPRDRAVLRKAVFFVMEHLQRLNDLKKDIKDTQGKSKLRGKEKLKFMRMMRDEYLQEGNNFLRPDDQKILKAKRFKKPEKLKKAAKSGKTDENTTPIMVTSQIDDGTNYGGFEKVSQPSIQASRPPQPSANNDPPIGLDAMSQNLSKNHRNVSDMKPELDDTQPSTTSRKVLMRNPSFGQQNHSNIPSSKNKIEISQNENHHTQDERVIQNELGKMGLQESFGFSESRAQTENNQEEFRHEISENDFREPKAKSGIQSPDASYFEKHFNHPFEHDENLEIQKDQFHTLGGGNDHSVGLKKSYVNACFIFTILEFYGRKIFEKLNLKFFFQDEDVTLYF